MSVPLRWKDLLYLDFSHSTFGSGFCLLTSISRYKLAQKWGFMSANATQTPLNLCLKTVSVTFLQLSRLDPIFSQVLSYATSNTKGNRSEAIVELIELGLALASRQPPPMPGKLMNL